MYPKDLPDDLAAVIVVQYRFGILAGGHRYGNDHVAVALTLRTAHHAPDHLNYVDRRRESGKNRGVRHEVARREWMRRSEVAVQRNDPSGPRRVPEPFRA